MQEALHELRLLIEALYPQFNRYVGAEAIGSASALYVTRPTRRTWAAAEKKGRSSARIYSGGKASLESSAASLPDLIGGAAATRWSSTSPVTRRGAARAAGGARATLTLRGTEDLPDLSALYTRDGDTFTLREGTLLRAIADRSKSKLGNAWREALIARTPMTKNEARAAIAEHDGHARPAGAPAHRAPTRRARGLVARPLGVRGCAHGGPGHPRSRSNPRSYGWRCSWLAECGWRSCSRTCARRAPGCSASTPPACCATSAVSGRSWSASGRTGGARGLPVNAELDFDHSDSAIGRALTTKAPARVSSYDQARGELPAVMRSLGMSASVATPVLVDGEPWGAIVATAVDEEALPPGCEQRLIALAELVAQAVANDRRWEELAASRMRLLEAGDETRRRLESGLHEGAHQHVVALALKLRVALGRADPASEEAEVLRDALADAMEAPPSCPSSRAGCIRPCSPSGASRRRCRRSRRGARCP